MAITRFNGDAAWANLSPAEQARIGAAAIELVLANHSAHHSDVHEIGDSPVVHRATQAAGALLVDMLDNAVQPIFGKIDFSEPPVPSLVGDVCESCGCTEQDACAEGCSWSRPGLCDGPRCGGRMNYAPPDRRRARALS